MATQAALTYATRPNRPVAPYYCPAIPALGVMLHLRQETVGNMLFRLNHAQGDWETKAQVGGAIAGRQMRLTPNVVLPANFGISKNAIFLPDPAWVAADLARQQVFTAVPGPGYVTAAAFGQAMVAAGLPLAPLVARINCATVAAPPAAAAPLGPVAGVGPLAVAARGVLCTGGDRRARGRGRGRAGMGAAGGIPATAGALASQGPLDGHGVAYLLAYPYGFKDDGSAYVYPDPTMM